LPFSTSSPSFILSGFLTALIVGGCSALPTLKSDPPFGRSDWIEFQNSHPVDGVNPALVVTIANQRNVPLWVRMEIDEIEGDNDCMNILKIEPNTSSLYSCPQVSLRAGKRFRAQAIVYKDPGNTDTVETINRLNELQVGADGRLELRGRPAD